MPEVYLGLSTKIINVTNNIYLIAYDNYGTPAVTLKTVEIAANGTISNTVLCSYNISKSGYSNFCSTSVLRIKGNVFAVSYHLTDYGSRNDFVTTIQVSPAGNITVIDTFSMNAFFSSIYGYDEYTDMIPLEGSNHLYALVYGYSYYAWWWWQHSLGKIITIQINDSGTINQNPFTTFTFDPNGCLRPDIIHINKNIYAITYKYQYYAWYFYLSIATINISTNGTVIKNVDAVSYYHNSRIIPYSQILVPIDKDCYALVFTWPHWDPYNPVCNGYFTTLRIAKNGSICRDVDNNCADAQIRLYPHPPGADTNANILPCCVKINDHMVAVCYQGNYDDGYIETINLPIVNTSKTLKNILSKAGSYAIQGNDTIVTATITTWSGDKTLSLPIHKGWNYLALTYDHATMKFFNNLTNVSVACNANLNAWNTRLLFGGFSGIYDEFAIYKFHLRDDEINNHYITNAP